MSPEALVADDHELFRAGAAAILIRDCGFRSVVGAASLDEAMTLLAQRPAITLACIDLGMPGVAGPLALKQIRQRFPGVRIAVITGSEDRDHILLALQSGVHGYVPKTLGIAEITRALNLVVAGGIYVPERVADLAPRLGSSGFHHEIEGALLPAVQPISESDLTARQQEVLRLSRSGKSNKEIGRQLGLSENTVKVHANALYRKLHVHTRQQAARLQALGAVND